MNSIIKTLIVLITLITSAFSYSQNEKDTKEFIIEKYNENFLEIYSPSFIFFSNNILKVDAESLTDRKLTTEEFAFLKRSAAHYVKLKDEYITQG